MIMNGLMRKFNYEEYYKQLEIMPDPIMASELPKVKLNLKGIRDYARKKVFQSPVFRMQKSSFLLKHKTNNLIHLPLVLGGNIYSYMFYCYMSHFFWNIFLKYLWCRNFSKPH